MEQKIKKIAIFIDGPFYLKVNSYFRYNHERKSTLRFRGIEEFVCAELAKLENLDKRFCRITETHWFRGRYSTPQLEKKYADDTKRLTFITNERKLDDIFMYENIIPHAYPLLIDSNTGVASEDIVKINLALEVYEQTLLKQIDIIVLFAGDTTFVPLIRKISGLGTRVMLLVWDFSYDYVSSSTVGKTVTTRTSQALINECTYPIMMVDRIEDRQNKNDLLINGLFYDSGTQARSSVFEYNP